MKKLLILGMTVVMCLSLAACTDPMGKYGSIIEDSKAELEQGFENLQGLVD